MQIIFASFKVCVVCVTSTFEENGIHKLANLFKPVGVLCVAEAALIFIYI